MRTRTRTTSAGGWRTPTAMLLAAVVAILGTAHGAPASASTPPAVGRASTPEDVLAAKASKRGRIRVIARLRVPMDARGRMRSILAGTPHAVVRTFESVPFVALEVGPAALARLRAATDVDAIEEDRLLSPGLAESVPLVGAPSAWAAGATGAGQTVAVLDTGIAGSHGFLAGKVVEEACYSANASCPDGSTAQVGPGAGAPCDYSGSCFHGTHVAGIVAGAGSSFSGVAPGANLMSVQVFSRFTGAHCGGAASCALAYGSDLVAGLERVYKLRTSYRFAAVNMSLGGGRHTGNCDSASPSLKTAIDNLRAAGIATVVASGNNGYADATSFPACISSAVSVGATTKTDAVAPFSNSSPTLSLLAPGLGIMSSTTTGGFTIASGTSMATPHVAGAFAAIKQASSTKSVTSILGALQSRGMPVTDPRNGLVRSRTDVARALSALGPTLTLTAPNGGETLTVGTSTTVRWAYTGAPGPYVRLQLWRGDGTLHSTIATSAPLGSAGAGSYAWRLPSTLAPGSYSLRVASTTSGGPADTGDAPFSVA